jgi:hypothetical protein
MRFLLLLVAGCHDYAHFSTQPGDGGCATMQAMPGCTLYTFGEGVPAALQAIDPLGAADLQLGCDGLHVHLLGGASHDFWIDTQDAFRLEERQPRDGAFNVTARVRGALDMVQKFSGVYAAAGDRVISVQTSTDDSGLHDHDVVFSFGAADAEQSFYPGANPAAGDDYSYGLRRAAGDLTSFTLTGTQTQALTVSAPSSLNVGVVVGNCCGQGTPAFDAVIEWLMVCQ